MPPAARQLQLRCILVTKIHRVKKGMMSSGAMYQNHLRSSFLVGNKSDQKRPGPGTHGCVVLLNPYSVNGLYGQQDVVSVDFQA